MTTIRGWRLGGTAIHRRRVLAEQPSAAGSARRGPCAGTASGREMVDEVLHPREVEAEDDVLVLGRIHVVAQRVGSRP